MCARDSRDVLDRIDADKETYLEELKDYIRIPSISTDPDHKDDVRRAAEFLRAKMQAAGLTAELIESAGHPLVYGEWTGAPAGAPTVLFYGHYDVQPVDPIDLWRNPPFEPTVEGAARRTTRGSRTPTSKACRPCSPNGGRCP
jgi:acetylornithine deacetylase/succinyl-diaminopimelate desuccinylase-like protein